MTEIDYGEPITWRENTDIQEALERKPPDKVRMVDCPACGSHVFTSPVRHVAAICPLCNRDCNGHRDESYTVAQAVAQESRP